MYVSVVGKLVGYRQNTRLGSDEEEEGRCWEEGRRKTNAAATAAPPTAAPPTTNNPTRKKKKKQYLVTTIIVKIIGGHGVVEGTGTLDQGRFTGDGRQRDFVLPLLRTTDQFTTKPKTHGTRSF